jgi:hypothetical protein
MMQYRIWKESLINPPKISTKYWVYINHETAPPLQEMAQYNTKDNTWESEYLDHNKGTVTHYTEILDPPIYENIERICTCKTNEHCIMEDNSFGKMIEYCLKCETTRKTL